ncbi:EamA family transporter [Nocardioides seonyuensis]|uniref:EamA family transporter n=1 Tax=Nocardioides seonyuensis TaxID=2518371 RepID=A0A4P7IF93_9ACTN|nr:EamA family transporter [Nocardioides seonyuensis]QBX55935.1 EamA family transporter [Nocardioides seonyuensis]
MIDTTHQQATRAKVLVALLLVYLVWGSIFLAIKVVVEEGAPPLWAMSVRFVCASVIMGGLLAARGGVRRLHVSARELRGTVVMGLLLLCFGNGLTSLGILGGVSSGGAALLVASTPMWIALFRTLDGDRPSVLALVGIALGAVGLVHLMSSGQLDVETAFPLIGSLIVLVSALSWSAGSYLQPRMSLPKDNLVGVTYQLLVAGIGLGIGALLRGEEVTLDFTPLAWLAVAFLAVLGSLVAFTAYSWLLGNAPISLVSTQAYVNPLVAVALGWLVFSEPVTPAMLLGSSLILASVLVLLYTERSARLRRVVATPPSLAPRP